MMVRPEDFLGQVEQVNMPGSTYEYPNWKRKLPLNLEDWPEDPRFTALADVLRSVRGSSAHPREQPATTGPTGAPLMVPLATYRLQFNRNFTFAQATAIVPYLNELGISHCYASPYLKARAGSMHGYDIIDHNALNPEIGSGEEFERFVAALREQRMGQILDIVPNHMGVLGSDNGWWMDVLENGQGSVYAGYFDIEWEPLNSELRGKVLLPVLGDHYGNILNNGELQLRFDEVRGEFSIHYFAHRFPLDPREYPRILAHQLEKIVSRLGADNAQALEFQSLLSAFGHLPPRTASAQTKLDERNRDKEFHKRHLAALCGQSSDILRFIRENITEFNGKPGDPASFDLLHQLIKAQAFRLAYWRVASDEINYRRFFDINDLAALRMENEAVFEATHRLIFELVAAGKVDGLRVDHPDGLYDPGQYFRRVQERFAALPRAKIESSPGEGSGRSIYLVIEKILAEFERLPPWPVHGTTGYRFLNVVNGLFVDTTGASKLERIYAKFIDQRIDFGELIYRSKRVIMRASLAGELTVLANLLSRIAQASRTTCDFTLNNLRDALLEIVACFPVYRSYITAGGVSVEDRRYIDWAVAQAKGKSRAADVTIFDFVRDVMTTDIAEGRPPGYREMVISFAMKFQQFTAPVMAKGVEDTSFYIYNRLVSLNDVGGDPRTFGFTLAAFHGASQDRAASWPHTMVTTSTHDTKRSEDVRARINVLSEMPAIWKLSLTRWSRMNRNKKRELDGKPAPSRNDEYLLYQMLLGAWPLATPDPAGLKTFSGRIERYMLKVVREAKVHSSWINPNAEYEKALADFVRALLGSLERNPFLADFMPLARRVARYGLLNSLSQTLIKLMSPGVPDIYQGNELWEFSLVDPDNRRPVDYPHRQKLLRELQDAFAVPAEQTADRARGLLDTMEDGRTKLYVTWRALQLRGRRQELFQQGDYVPLIAEGECATHVVAFARRRGAATVIVVAPRLVATLAGDAAALTVRPEVWGNTAIPLSWLEPHAEFHGVLDGRVHRLTTTESGPCLLVGPLVTDFPVALLEFETPG
jgi:(1->4)-alpha-D-glucan 1-alpha-D-glucosylmutase